MQSIPHASDPGDRGPIITAWNIIVAVLATIAVGLRVLSRHLQRLPLQADDYLMLAALVRTENPEFTSDGTGLAVRLLTSWNRIVSLSDWL